MRTVTIGIVLIVLFVGPAGSETLRFPLASFTGGFGKYGTTLTYTGEARRVDAVFVRVTASVEQVGRVFCIHAPGVPEEYWGWFVFGPRINAGLWINGDHDRDFALDSRTITQQGLYDRRLELPAAPGFDRLENGDQIYVSFGFFSGDPVCLPEYPGMLEYTLASLTAVTLLIRLSEVVPVERTTWGHIKSMYGE